MASEPMHALVALFDTEAGASGALASLRDQWKSVGTIKHAAVLRADAGGKLHITETDDMGGRKGLIIGGVTGGVLGLLGAAVVPPLAIGAAIGGLAAKMRDSGFRNDGLKALGAQVQPGHSMLVIAASDGVAAEKFLEACDATVVREAVDGQLAAALEIEAVAATEAASPEAEPGQTA